MFNKLLIVLALLITLSIATRLEFLSLDNKCEYGTLQEVMDESKKIRERYDLDSLLKDVTIKMQLSFIEKIAGMMFAPVHYEEETWKELKQYEKYISNDVFNYALDRNFLMARTLLIGEIGEKLKPLFENTFAIGYINSILYYKSRTPDSCLNKNEYDDMFNY